MKRVDLKTAKKIAEAPYVILASMIGGILMGIYFPSASHSITYVGEIYFSLLQMCVIPIVFTAITYSMATLAKQKNINLYLHRIFVVFVVGLLLTGVLSVIVCSAFRLGKNLDDQSKQVIGALIEKTERHESLEGEGTKPVMTFLHSMVAKNIFKAFSEDKIMAILFFSMVFGFSLGKTPKDESAAVFEFFDDLNQTFLRLIGAFLYALPIGLFCLFAGQISTFGLSIFFTLIKIVVVIYLLSVASIGIFTFILWRIRRGNFFRTLSELREPIIVAFATSSSFASIPSAARALEENVGLDRKITQLVLPLGVCFNPIGSTLLITTISMFMFHFYDFHLTIQTFFVLIFGSIFTGIAMSGVPAVGTHSMLSIVLSPLGLPVGPAVVVTMVILPVVEPIVTSVNIMGNCLATVFLAKKRKSEIIRQ